MKRFDKEGKPIKIKRRMKDVKYLKAGERRMLFNHLKGEKGFMAARDLAVVQAAMMAGLRCEELYHLDVCDLYPEPGPGAPRRVIDTLEVVGKGDVLRVVPVSEKFHDAVVAFLKVKKEAGECIDPEIGVPMFCNDNGERLSYRSIQSIVERRCIKAGLTKVVDGKVKARFSVHSLQHTFAVMWLREHRALAPYEAVKRLSQIMGHDSTETTSIYLGFDVTGE